MISTWLRGNKYAAALLMITRLYLGYTWLTAGWHKITGGFEAGGFLNNAIAKPVIDKSTNELIYPTFTAFLEGFALPNVKIINVLIPWGEFLVGVGLLLGCLTTAAAFFGLLMNFMFLFAGTVSTNPWMVLIGGIVIAGGANAGIIGVDHYLLPYMHHLFDRRNNGSNNRKKDLTPAH
jgi:thiosulfate dehydrogenase [quinone] large subunit